MTIRYLGYVLFDQIRLWQFRDPVILQPIIPPPNTTTIPLLISGISTQSNQNTQSMGIISDSIYHPSLCAYHYLSYPIKSFCTLTGRLSTTCPVNCKCPQKLAINRFNSSFVFSGELIPCITSGDGGVGIGSWLNDFGAGICNGIISSLSCMP